MKSGVTLSLTIELKSCYRKNNLLLFSICVNVLMKDE